MDRLIIQSDWQDLFCAKLNEIWVQYKNSSASAINGIIRLSTDTAQTYNGTNGFSLEKLSNRTAILNYKYDDNKIISTKFISPETTFKIHKKSVIAIDVSKGDLGVSASLDNTFYVWQCNNGEIRRELNGHVSEITTCKFFPSGLVVLSGSSDLRLKVWSIENGSCPVTLIGHTSGVTETAVIDKGKNIVSVGRDGSCNLWDVGESKCLSRLAKFDCIINSCSITECNNIELLPVSNQPMSDREVGTVNKLVALACEDGFLRIIAVLARQVIFELNCEGPVNCCCFLNENTVACGTQDGYILIWDLLNPTQPSNSWKEYRSSILSLRPFGTSDGFIATTADGSCFTWHYSQLCNVIEFTGPDCDPIYNVSFNNTHLYSCCRDGLIRKYNLNDLL